MGETERPTLGFDRLSPNGRGVVGLRARRRLHPFTLSLSKGPMQEGFDRLSPNGVGFDPFTLSLSKGPKHQRIEAKNV